MATIPLKTAKATEMRAFALNTLGLEWPLMKKAVEMRSVLQEAGYTEIDGIQDSLDDASPAPGETEPAETEVEPVDPMEIYHEIEIPTSEAPGGSNPVPVGCNGSHIFLPRGERIRVRAKYLGSLRHAVQTVYPEGSEGMEPRQVETFPFIDYGVSPDQRPTS